MHNLADGFAPLPRKVRRIGGVNFFGERDGQQDARDKDAGLGVNIGAGAARGRQPQAEFALHLVRVFFIARMHLQIQCAVAVTRVK